MITERQPKIRVPSESRVCVYSQRQLKKRFSTCGDYEFEDLLCEFDNADLLIAQPSYCRKIRQKISSRLIHHASVSFVNPGARKFRIKRDYELFFAKFLVPRDLLALNAVKDWRKRCRVAVCWLAELWAGDLVEYKGYAKILSQFDYVILNCSASVQPIQDMIKRPCLYVSPGVDAIKFCPYPNPPLRSVDVYSIGRKSQVTHKALLKMAQEKKIFYIYDTSLTMETALPTEHRSLIANIAKRSRYFIVNPAKINRPSDTGGQNEIGFRYFEGAAAGTVMIGEHPKTEAFQKDLGWPDSVIHVPFDASNMAEILAEFDSQPARMEQARKNNAAQSLLRHDWAYRWKVILDLAGLNPLDALAEREERLKNLAAEIAKA